MALNMHVHAYQLLAMQYVTISSLKTSNCLVINFVN